MKHLAPVLPAVGKSEPPECYSCAVLFTAASCNEVSATPLLAFPGDFQVLRSQLSKAVAGEFRVQWSSCLSQLTQTTTWNTPRAETPASEIAWNHFMDNPSWLGSTPGAAEVQATNDHYEATLMNHNNTYGSQLGQTTGNYTPKMNPEKVQKLSTCLP